MVARLRPFELQPAVQLLIHEPWDYSFPSGHAWSALAAVIILFMNKIPGRYVALGVALLISFQESIYMCTIHQMSLREVYLEWLSVWPVYTVGVFLTKNTHSAVP